MSTDTVDDLHLAEEVLATMAGNAQAALDAVRNHPDGRMIADGHLRAIISMGDDYCRPTCGGGVNCDEWCRDGLAGCACPCHAGEEPDACPHDPDGQHFIGCGCDHTNPDD